MIHDISELKPIVHVIKKCALYFILSILINLLSKGLLSPLLFILLLYRTPRYAEIPWHFIVITGIFYDSIFYMPIGFHPVLFLTLQACINYGQKFTFERSQFRYWGGFGILCFIGYIAETFGRFLIGHDMYINLYICVNYALLWSLYPIFQALGDREQYFH
ncbi:MAG TPA: hypothetical protein DIC42_05685 [Holosporales bacterium]|nr:hypothetical protein [Holosporales bacterium]